MAIKYIKGDATEIITPINETVYIPHICNNVGLWGKGFVVSVSKRWKAPERLYRNDINNMTKNKESKLGEIQTINVQDNIYVINMIAQRIGGKHPLVNSALEKCMAQIAENFKQIEEPKRIQCPKFGAGLAGGNWETEIVPLINKYWNDFDVYVYQFTQK